MTFLVNLFDDFGIFWFHSMGRRQLDLMASQDLQEGRVAARSQPIVKVRTTRFAVSHRGKWR
jgi:hypothetical protein